MSNTARDQLIRRPQPLTLVAQIWFLRFGFIKLLSFDLSCLTTLHHKNEPFLHSRCPFHASCFCQRFRYVDMNWFDFFGAEFYFTSIHWRALHLSQLSLSQPLSTTKFLHPKLLCSTKTLLKEEYQSTKMENPTFGPSSQKWKYQRRAAKRRPATPWSLEEVSPHLLFLPVSPWPTCLIPTNSKYFWNNLDATHGSGGRLSRLAEIF